MIACEKCGRYTKEINRCPECDSELCDSCYQPHVKVCVIGLDPFMQDDEDSDYE